MKHISFKCKSEGKKFKPNQIWDYDKCQCECKNPRKKVHKM